MSFFCHTDEDECVDDGDCPAGDECSYDTVKKHWACEYCLVPP